MFGLFGKKSVGWVGVDIGSSSVKVVALTGQGEQLRLDSYAVVSLPSGVVTDGAIQDAAAVANAVEQAVRISGTALKRGIVAVPASSVITKRLELSDAFTEMELEDQIRVEADQFIPYALDEVALDFEVLGPANGHAGLNDILLVACRRDQVDQREDALAGSGLKCDVVDVDSYAIERVMPLLTREVPENALVGLVDIGATTLTLNVFRGNQIVYSREQAFGGAELVRAIQLQYNIEEDEVVNALRRNEVSDEIREMVLLPFRGTVVQQISRALQFFYSSEAHSQLDQLLLMGGTALLDGVADQLQEEEGVPTLLANPFAAMNCNPKYSTDQIQRDAPSLVKACGLALRATS
ncbi:type IV pilus assembly protein PilM [Marinobacterium arenosum]|uniref:type IV pilus assembly protein PilM n=1 Tax=Marinobacterium arenosum TaxID=2862496 RepID=UPI001C943335|nr:type IV pilus assembly protein PilM [Marinobacterium arenosum]MBY4675590.1 pilus assembly protein PilM [Marinobacterium arenosum]